MFTNHQKADPSVIKRNVVRIIPIAVLVLIFCFSVFAFAACSDKDDNPKSEEATVSVYIGENAPIKVVTDKTNVFDVLVMMYKYGGLKTFGYEVGAYGAYLTELGDLSQDAAASRYIVVYHSIDDITIRDMSEFAAPNEIKDGITFYSSGVGVSGLPVKEGAAYYFTTVTYA